MRIDSNQKDSPEGEGVSLVAHQQPLEAGQPGEDPLNFPALCVTFANSHRTPTLRKKEEMR